MLAFTCLTERNCRIFCVLNMKYMEYECKTVGILRYTIVANYTLTNNTIQERNSSDVLTI